MDNVYQYKANYFLWIGVTTFYEKLITVYIDSFVQFSWIEIHLDSIKNRKNSIVAKEARNIVAKKTWNIVAKEAWNIVAKEAWNIVAEWRTEKSPY